MWQFLLYRHSQENLLGPRFFLAIGIFVLTLVSGAIWIETLRSASAILSWLPLVSTMILLPLATHSQFQLNKTDTGLLAVPISRYRAYIISNMASLIYGFGKGTESGFQDSWTICAVATYGLLSNRLLIFQSWKRQSQFPSIAYSSLPSA